jgi:hypothetical protein
VKAKKVKECPHPSWTHVAPLANLRKKKPAAARRTAVAAAAAAAAAAVPKLAE